MNTKLKNKTEKVKRVSSFDAFMRKVRNIYYTDNKQMERAYNIVFNHVG